MTRSESPRFDFADYAEAFCTGFIAHRNGVPDSGYGFSAALMASWREAGTQRARDALGLEIDPVSQGMVERAADAMWEAYQPDEGDDPRECWLAAMRSALGAALDIELPLPPHDGSSENGSPA
jgi:hypothetical protein